MALLPLEAFSSLHFGQETPRKADGHGNLRYWTTRMIIFLVVVVIYITKNVKTKDNLIAKQNEIFGANIRMRTTNNIIPCFNPGEKNVKAVITLNASIYTDPNRSPQPLSPTWGW